MIINNMDSYNNKVTKIKATIDEIRDDIETMKFKNEKTINSMMNSLSKISRYKLQESNQEIEKDCNDYRSPFENNLMDRFGYYSPINRDSSYPVNYNITNNQLVDENFMKKSPGGNVYSKTPEVLYGKRNKDIYDKPFDYTPNNKLSESVALEKQISELQVTVNELQKKNSYLQMQLSESKQQPYNTNLSASPQRDSEKRIKNELVINELKVLLRTTSVDDIVPLVKDSINSAKSSSKKEELIEKLKSLYLTLTGSEISDNRVELTTLWRWIKNIIQQVTEKEARLKYNDGQVSNNDNDIYLYKEYCDFLMKEYNLRNLNELQVFINRLLEKNMKNQRRVEKIKKLLMLEPTKAHKNYV